MGFSQSTITEVTPPKIWGRQLSLSWSSSSPLGTWYQLYLNGVLAWFGQRTAVRIPIPPNGSDPHRVDIGTVLPGEEQTSFASSLVAAPARRAQLTWLGGSFLGDDIAGFFVYGGTAPSGAVSYTTALATITAYPAGIMTDGFGLGGFGDGGFGQSGGTYSWTSNPLAAGTWNFAIVPFDAAGNSGTGATTSIVIVAPPLSPAPNPAGLRATYTYSSSTHEVTLSWLASGV